MNRRLVAGTLAVATAAFGVVTLTLAPAASAATTTVTQAFQCTSTAFGASQTDAPQDLDVTVVLPTNVTYGSPTDVAQVSVAAASSNTAPASPQVALANVSLSLQVGIDLVSTSGVTPPAANAPANGVSQGAASSVTIPSVDPSTPWSVTGPVPVPLAVPGINANDVIWPRVTSLTYAWTADGGTAGSTTCTPVDDSGPLPGSSVANPVYGVYPPMKAPYAGNSTVILGPISTTNVCSTPTTGCEISEEIDGDVNPGNLSLSQLANQVTFQTVTLNGSPQPSNAALNQLTIVDARGNGAPWTLTASMTDFANSTQTTGGNRVIPATALSWVPTCTPTTALPGSVVTGGSGGFVAGAGSTMGNPTTASRVLCDHGTDLGGGTWTADAAMTLTVPPSIRTGLYKATMFLTIA